jgi:endonuclease/exonuclease/phosphatase family metal-dependent hydrolase
MIKKFLKLVGLLLVFLILFLASFLIYSTATDFKPEEKVLISKSADADQLELGSNGLELTLFSWNIGYAGLHNEMDFFYSGGKQVYPKEEVVVENFAGILDVVRQNADADMFLLQEVDRHAKRSHFINQPEGFVAAMPDYRGDFARNYDVSFVPLPIRKPMGRVESGLLTLSRYKSFESMRHSFEGNFSWPMGLFMLDRCFLVNRFHLNNGKQLIVINTHNSAYDDGSLREGQMKQISTFLDAEYAQGNYVIVGGDWNQCPPSFEADFAQDKMDNVNRKDIPESYMPEWTWAYDTKEPTNRRNFMVYKKGETPATVIDFFLLSPNIALESVENIKMDFRWSDHQAAKVKLRLLP